MRVTQGRPVAIGAAADDVRHRNEDRHRTGAGAHDLDDDPLGEFEAFLATVLANASENASEQGEGPSARPRRGARRRARARWRRGAVRARAERAPRSSTRGSGRDRHV